MAEMQTGVKEEPVAPVTSPVVETPTPSVSEDVKPQDSSDYKALYEKAKEEAENKAVALKETREREKAEREARIALEAQMQYQPAPQSNDNDEAVQMFYENKAKTDLLTLAVTDPFVKDNFNLVLQELAQNPMQGADVASMRVKSSIMDGIIKSAEIAKPVAQATPTPGATPESQNNEAFFNGDEQGVIAEMDARLKAIR